MPDNITPTPATATAQSIFQITQDQLLAIQAQIKLQNISSFHKQPYVPPSKGEQIRKLEAIQGI